MARRRKRYLDNAAPADNTANVIRPVIVRRDENIKARSPERQRVEQQKARDIAERNQRISSTFARTPAGRRAANRAYAVESQRQKQEAAKEEAAAVVGSLFKPLMPSTYVDMAAAIKNGQVNNLTDALAAPYLSDAWSMRNPGKALAVDIAAPFALSKGTQLAKFAGRDIANSWRDMRYALAHPESQTYGIVANSPYGIETLPGYHIGSLQRGNVLEKQLSKAGTISLKSIQGVINNPNTPKVDKYILKQLVNNHNGEKVIDYNTLRREAQEFIPKYNRVPQTKFEDYGGRALGLTMNGSIDEPYLAKTIPDKYWNELKDFNPLDPNAFDPIDARELYLYDHPDVFRRFEDMALRLRPDYETFTFESPGIVGNTQHYSGEPLGHTRTYVTVDEPNVLHIMETQSDWGQRPLDKPHLHGNRANTTAYLNDPDAYRDFINRHRGLLERMEAHPEEYREGAIERQRKNIEHHEAILSQILGDNPVINRIHNNYLQRQLQENMLYGAERGKSLLRYPTSETAAKIEGYSKDYFTPEYKEALDAYSKAADRANKFKYGLKATPIPKDIEDRITELKRLGKDRTYKPEHQTILKKYSDFPKMFSKLFKEQQVRNVTDNLGNTWYEVDIPSDMLQRELKFKLGGRIRSLRRM